MSSEFLCVNWQSPIGSLVSVRVCSALTNHSGTSGQRLREVALSGRYRIPARQVCHVSSYHSRDLLGAQPESLALVGSVDLDN